MAISEQVLFKELAQIQVGHLQKAEKEAIRSKQFLKPVKTKTEQSPTVSKLEILEREIIKILLLYGNKEVTIDDWEIKEIPEDNAEPIVEKYEKNIIIAEEIYKQLQEDELKFSNPVFNEIYHILIEKNLKRENIDISQLMGVLPEESTRLISDILMEEEKYHLSSKWEEKKIEVKPKDDQLGWHVTDVLLNLRRILIQDLINQQKESLREDTDNEKVTEIFNELKDYLLLYRIINSKLYRVV